MKLIYIVPGQLPDKEIKRREKVANTLVREGTEVTVEKIKGGPLDLESAPEEYMAIPPTLDKLYEVKDDYDAAIIGCYFDPGIRAARELVDIPVIGPGESSIYLALMVGDDFSIITVLERDIPIQKSILREMSISHLCKSVRSVGIPVQELSNDHEKSLKALEKTIEFIGGEDKASTVILGCMSEAFLLADEEIDSKIPIINPAKAALRIAELFVNMNLKHSLISYPKPNMEKLKKANLI